jgi:hypothetical protein
MSKKSFKIARKPGQGSGAQAATVAPTSEAKARTRKSAPTMPAIPTSAGVGLTTRKTIEVPEDYFRRVKIRAVERGMLEKELWSEILGEYFKNHPTT